MAGKTSEERIATGEKAITENRRARHDYHVEETFEAGMALVGTEVKSLREGLANLQDSWVKIEGEEALLVSAHISPFEKGNRFNHDPVRVRKLLLHKQEIRYLYGKVKQKGLTLIPLKMYFKKGRAKLLLALAKGKREHDKRDAIADREAQREIQRVQGARFKGR
ncbi:MAG TPA: SsrA-binding protein SmpB [Candidatus Xenobia bacterium]|jgi:SsrA-binding protein